MSGIGQRNKRSRTVGTQCDVNEYAKIQLHRKLQDARIEGGLNPSKVAELKLFENVEYAVTVPAGEIAPTKFG